MFYSAGTDLGRDNLMQAQIYLASTSPRRRQLLEQIQVRYQLLEVDCDETRHPGERAQDYVTRLALEKAREGWRVARYLRATQGAPALPVLGADTAVVVDDVILGKPVSSEEANEMLARLSGRSHLVMTGVAMAGDHEVQRLNVSTVEFRVITDWERAEYCASGEPLDKAGGYAIQGTAAVFVACLEGSYSGVMGLPLFETAKLLSEFNIDILQTQDLT